MADRYTQPEVLILGGGLAGAAAAITLARGGRHVTLVERELVPRNKVCGEFLSAEALQLIGHLNLAQVFAHAHPIHTVRLASSRTVTEAPLPFAAASFTRRCLDHLLLEAATQAGVTVLRGHTVEALTRVGERWQAALSNGEALLSPQVILATGKHDLRGFPRPRGVQGDLVALKTYLRLAPDQAEALAHSVELLLHPDGYTGLEPVEDGTANLTALVRRQHLARLGGWPNLLAELIRTNPHAAKRLRHADPLLNKPLAISSIPYGFVRREAVAPHLFAVGDQAAVIPSFTGDGMSLALYTGLQAARSVLRGEPAESFQPAMHRTLRGQVSRATALSRALVFGPSKTLLAAGARLWPGGLQAAASLTRLRQAALVSFSGSDL